MGGAVVLVATVAAIDGAVGAEAMVGGAAEETAATATPRQPSQQCLAFILVVIAVAIANQLTHLDPSRRNCRIMLAVAVAVAVVSGAVPVAVVAVVTVAGARTRTGGAVPATVAVMSRTMKVVHAAAVTTVTAPVAR